MATAEERRAMAIEKLSKAIEEEHALLTDFTLSDPQENPRQGRERRGSGAGGHTEGEQRRGAERVDREEFRSWG